MAKLIREPALHGNHPDAGHRLYIFCPACYQHAKEKVPDNPGFWIHGSIHCITDTDWSFNGDYDKPTINPSLNTQLADGTICHSFVKDGTIMYLDDCTHMMAGKTVQLLDSKEWDDWYATQLPTTK